MAKVSLVEPSSKVKTIDAMIEARNLPNNFNGNIIQKGRNVCIKLATSHFYYKYKDKDNGDKFYYKKPRDIDECKIMRNAIKNNLNIFILKVPVGKYKQNVYRHFGENSDYWILTNI